jgi:hypothetical protein
LIPRSGRLRRDRAEGFARQRAPGAARAWPWLRRQGVVATLALGLLLSSLPRTAGAFPPERRRDYENRSPNEYLLVPAVASLPGIGVFAGVIASGSNLADTGIDAGATVAESIDDSDISLRAVALQGVPTGIPHLSFDYQWADITLGNFDAYLPGRDSPNFTIPITARFKYQFIRPTLRLWERRIVLTYGLAFFDGFDLDTSGNELPLRQHSADAALLLDLTDDVVDPHAGVRLTFGTTLPAPRSSIFGKDAGTESQFGNDRDIRVRNFSATLYWPATERVVLAWSNQIFAAVGDIPAGEVVSGGSPPLRGYPEGRWRDRYGVFSGLEARYIYPLGVKLDIVLAHGVLEALQFVGFYEVGQVSPQQDHSLFEDMHQSYGVGARALFEAIVLRFDLATSDEGLQTHLTIGHAF